MTEQVNAARAISSIKSFLSSKLAQSGLSGYVIGLSGGIDSALSATLAAQAVGADRVLALLMPYKSSSKDSVADAMALIDRLGLEYRQIDITPMVDAYFERVDRVSEIRRGNKMARERMSILFDVARETNRLVLGTGNRTEICLGYTTWYGDSACSVNPLGELYKSEVRLLAEEVGIPQQIIAKPPSADLWAGQTDEGEIGLTYEKMDRLLRRLVDDGERSTSRLEAEGFEKSDIERVASLLTRYSFKRRVPDIAPLGRASIPAAIELEA
ncbi:MAG: NAD+ synthase [Candidatus Zixiibacteriota bacterium]|nr:MAG: NAD+ synthase [candidate division Zixibacteria bacterium]